MIPGVEHHNTHVATAAVVTGGLILISILARVSLGKGDTAVIPAGRFSLKGVFEALTEFIASTCDMVLGKAGKPYRPLFASVFTFILINNLVGLIPGMTPATDNFNTTFAVGIFSFLVYNIVGIKERGWRYLEDFTGHLPLSFFWLMPLMIIIEMISHGFRPVTLGLRLAGNMTGDHSVLGFFLENFPYGPPIIFYCLGLLVCLIQAYVFTLLSMTYVMMAQPHDDH